MQQEGKMRHWVAKFDVHQKFRHLISYFIRSPISEAKSSNYKSSPIKTETWRSNTDVVGKQYECILSLLCKLCKIRIAWPRVTAVTIKCVRAISRVYLAMNDNECLHEQWYTMKFCVQQGKTE